MHDFTDLKLNDPMQIITIYIESNELGYLIAPSLPAHTVHSMANLSWFSLYILMAEWNEIYRDRYKLIKKNQIDLKNENY